MVNNYKLIGLILCFFVSQQSLAQTSDTREILEQRVEEINKILPVSTMQGFVLQKMYIVDSSVYEILEVNERYISLASLRHKKGTMKKGLLDKYGKDSNLLSFAQIVVECNMDLVYLYVSKQSGDSFQIVFKTKELAKCVE